MPLRLNRHGGQLCITHIGLTLEAGSHVLEHIQDLDQFADNSLLQKGGQLCIGRVGLALEAGGCVPQPLQAHAGHAGSHCRGRTPRPRLPQHERLRAPGQRAWHALSARHWHARQQPRACTTLSLLARWHYALSFEHCGKRVIGLLSNQTTEETLMHQLLFACICVSVCLHIKHASKHSPKVPQSAAVKESSCAPAARSKSSTCPRPVLNLPARQTSKPCSSRVGCTRPRMGPLVFPIVVSPNTCQARAPPEMV